MNISPLKTQLKIPNYLKKQIGKNKAALRNCKSLALQNMLSDNSIHTVCNEALCPNKGKCFSRGEATFLILGNICTRRCRFCAVKKSKPLKPNKTEPFKTADAVKRLNLKYVVITSPTRDDLPDGGALHYAKVIEAVRQQNLKTEVEILVPDFQGKIKPLKILLENPPEVFSHNIETVPELYRTVRSGANYVRSLKVLETAKKINKVMPVKSGLMLGLGETASQVKRTLKDLVNAGCDILTLGQYLAPSNNHNIVKRFVTLKEFRELKNFALSIGFKAVASAPLVRSSYNAGYLYKEYLKKVSF